MANPVCEVLLTEAALECPEAGPGEGEGAVVDFRGVVRPLEDGEKIEGIYYEANGEMASHQLRVIADQAMKRFGLNLVQIHHRVGFVAAGEASLFLRVTAPHRGEAFEASQWLIGELKKKVPIWKEPKFSGKSVRAKTAPRPEPRAALRK
jgi:molybdopterin synthase catalytic subunit